MRKPGKLWVKKVLAQLTPPLDYFLAEKMSGKQNWGEHVRKESGQNWKKVRKRKKVTQINKLVLTPQPTNQPTNILCELDPSKMFYPPSPHSECVFEPPSKNLKASRGLWTLCNETPTQSKCVNNIPTNGLTGLEW